MTRYELLQKLEWSGQHESCPICNGSLITFRPWPLSFGHSGDCELAKALIEEYKIVGEFKPFSESVCTCTVCDKCNNKTVCSKCLENKHEK